jgi:hypothetical protein
MILLVVKHLEVERVVELLLEAVGASARMPGRRGRASSRSGSGALLSSLARVAKFSPASPGTAGITACGRLVEQWAAHERDHTCPQLAAQRLTGACDDS